MWTTSGSRRRVLNLTAIGQRALLVVAVLFPLSAQAAGLTYVSQTAVGFGQSWVDICDGCYPGDEDSWAADMGAPTAAEDLDLLVSASGTVSGTTTSHAVTSEHSAGVFSLTSEADFLSLDDWLASSETRISQFFTVDEDVDVHISGSLQFSGYDNPLNGGVSRVYLCATTGGNGLGLCGDGLSLMIEQSSLTDGAIHEVFIDEVIGLTAGSVYQLTLAQEVWSGLELATGDVSLTIAPEPSTAAMFTIGLAGLASFGARRR
jgi:hypothetical protein